jgi:hypothetical protein
VEGLFCIHRWVDEETKGKCVAKQGDMGQAELEFQKLYDCKG